MRPLLCKWATRTASDLPFKNFCKLAKQAQKIRNSAEKDFGYDYSFSRKLRNYLSRYQSEEISSWTNAQVFCLQQPARAVIIHSNREIKEVFDPEKLTLSIDSEHKSALKSPGSSSLRYSLPSLWKLATLTILDHATWQHPRENPRHVRGAARIYDVRMVQFVLKIENLSHIMGPRASQHVSRLTVSVPDYGSCYRLINHLGCW